MKKHSYGKLISMSWDWTAQILFRPLNMKKWIALGIIILLAGQMAAGGFNFNFKGDTAGVDINKFISGLKGTPVEKWMGTALAAGSVILLFAIWMLLCMWVASNFSFVFIDSVLRNDTSMRIPFHRNKRQGNSYFRWNVAFTSAVILLFGAIAVVPAVIALKGDFTGVSLREALAWLLPCASIFAISGVLIFLIHLFTADFILPIMYKKKTGILKGWGLFLRLLKKNTFELVKYVLLKILLFIVSVVVLIFLAIAALIIVGGIGVLAVLLGWFIYSVTPVAAKASVLTALSVIGAPVFIFLGLLGNAIFIPVPVFFRVFSINVLGSMDESFDLFTAKTPEEIANEGDDAQYKKSMRLVWLTVLFPLLVAAAVFISAIVLPAAVKGSRGGRGIKLPDMSDIKRMMRFEEHITLEAIPAIRELKPENTVKVYLKNGNSFEAAVENETKHNIAFRVEGGTVTLRRDEISRIEKNKAKRKEAE